MKLFKKELHSKITWLGNELFGVKNPNTTIKRFELLFMLWNCPINLSFLKLKPHQIQEFKQLLLKNKPNGMIHKLNEEQLLKLVDLME